MSKMLDDVVDSGGIDVIIQNESDKPVPRCPHGPALLFEKTGNGEEKGRRFYACSACRDRKDCSFFQWADEKVSEARMLAREEQNRSKMPLFSHQEYCSRFREFVSLPLEQRRFCVDCQLLILPREWANHAKHKALSEDITVQRLKRPSLLLCPLDNKKSNAQYLFADRSCHFLLDMLLGLGFQKILCVGTPRYCQFYAQDEFCRYNMFNHHFFDDEEVVTFFQRFLQEEGGAKVVMVTDPPFGGLVKPLANSFSQIAVSWKNLNKVSDASQMPMIWIFPYFFESRILECFPSFSMLDYQVDYENHPLYKHGKTGRKQSPHGVIVPHVVTVLSLITLVVGAKLAVSTVAAKNTNLELNDCARHTPGLLKRIAGKSKTKKKKKNSFLISHTEHYGFEPMMGLWLLKIAS
ncbi:rRNA N6-adenosine-methyltransferase ZCCHC4 [Labeo rohita]|uniref:rRNA N(6)-adenosine-methyltransferase ZCCHC4 n=1 Tax=Labeo rohita TaxID=84645 RepID=A0ABQ8M6F9_LABRO|nr:rRNA N6-adenosine-methyltransferase ZCCHC4 [Labeo rohita]